MAMQLQTANDIKIYNVSAGKILPEWLTNSNKSKKSEAFRKRLELIQDFEFPVAANKIKFTPDGTHIVATGVYKPQVRVFDLDQLSLKFDRHMDCETTQFQILSKDWTKIAFLQADRAVDFHTQFGFHYRTRVPKFGRDMAFDSQSADLLLVGASNQVWRLNLEQGRYMQPLVTNSKAINVCQVSSAHGLYAFGDEDGRVEFWDPRSHMSLGFLDTGAMLMKSHYEQRSIPEISSLQFHPDGLTVAIGTSSGHVALYDLRHSNPLLVKDHQYGYAIKDIKFHSTSTDKIISTDTQVVRVWNKLDGKTFTSIEPESHINDIAIYPNSGLILIASEAPKMSAFYVPSLGPAPHWCSFLDNLTEELEERPSMTIYDDYKFVTRANLSELGLDHLVGTNLLRAHMHGFFIDARLYEKAKLIANPFAYEDFKKKQIEEKLAKERQSRILLEKKLPKINKKFAEKLMQDSKSDDSSANPLGDSRFSAIFTNPEFQIEEQSEEYRRLHPHEKRQALVQELFEAEEEEAENEDQEKEGSDDNLYDLSDLNEDRRTKVMSATLSSDSEEDEIDMVFDKRKKKMDVASNKKSGKGETRPVALHSLKSGATLENVLKPARKENNVLQQMSLAERLSSMTTSGAFDEDANDSAPRVGPMTMSFNHNDRKQKQSQGHKDGTANHRERRGVRGLKFKRMRGFKR